MVASGAITSTLGVITSLSCIVVLLASSIGGALPVCTRACYLPAPCPSRALEGTTPPPYEGISRRERPYSTKLHRTQSFLQQASPCLGMSLRKFHTTRVCRAGPTAGDGACNYVEDRQSSQIERGILTGESQNSWRSWCSHSR